MSLFWYKHDCFGIVRIAWRLRLPAWQASQAVTSPSAFFPRRGDALPPWDLRDYISRSRSRSRHVMVHSATAGSVINNVIYANPVYGIATICHQVRWLRWGHPRLFHTATSLLIWYKMFCVRHISYRLIWMEFINMFSVYAKSGTHMRFNG